MSLGSNSSPGNSAPSTPSRGSPHPHSSTCWRVEGGTRPCTIDCGGSEAEMFRKGGMLSMRLCAKEVLLELVSDDDKSQRYGFKLSNYQGCRSLLFRDDESNSLAERRHAPLLSEERFTQVWVCVRPQDGRLEVSSGWGTPSKATALFGYIDNNPISGPCRVRLSAFGGCEVRVADIRMHPLTLPLSELSPEPQGTQCGDSEWVKDVVALSDNGTQCTVKLAEGHTRSCPAAVLAAATGRGLKPAGEEFELELPQVPAFDFDQWFRSVTGCRSAWDGPATSALGFGRGLSGRLRNMMEEWEMTDFVLEVRTDREERLAGVHAAVLRRFPAFEGLLRTDCVETRERTAVIDLTTSSGRASGTETAKAFILSLYLGSPTPALHDAVAKCAPEAVLALLYCAQGLGVSVCVAACEERLCHEAKTHRLGVVELSGLAHIAELLGLANLRRICVSRLQKPETRADESEWAELPSSALCEVLREDGGLPGLDEVGMLRVVSLHITSQNLSEVSPWPLLLLDSLRLLHLPESALAAHAELRYVSDNLLNGLHLSPDPSQYREESLSAGTTIPATIPVHLARSRKGGVEVLCPNKSHQGLVSRLQGLHSGVNLVKAGVIGVASSSSKNPQSQGSGLFATRGHVGLTAFPTKKSATAFVEFDFHNQKLVPSHYELTHDTSGGDYLRSWVFEGYDPLCGEWCPLDERLNDTDIDAPRATAVFGIDGVRGRPFSRFRIQMKGPNSEGGQALTLGRVELYGQLEVSC
eukprot:Hpha_TRINITY_DN15865_c4_g13::TRINITY_DN15865_c4_g13_i1::g.188423::m.188423